jgi:hypothetical protein
MKGLSKIIGLVLILLGIPLFANAQPQLSLGSASGLSGGTASMTLSFSSDGTVDYAGVNAKVLLPAGVTLSGVTRGALLSTAFTVDSHNPSGTVIAYSGTDVFSASTGVLLTLNLQIGSEVAPGDYSVVFADSDGSSLVNPEHALSNADGSVSPEHDTYAEPKNFTVTSGVVTLPTVVTTAVSSTTSSSASSGGNVTSNGGAPITARGVCWGTSPNPITANSHTTDGTGTGAFTSAITGLTPGTAYHVRAYATNSVGSSYGADLPFSANAEMPTVTTTAVSGVTPTSAISGGNVTSNGGAPVTARGLCWGTSVNPTTANTHTTDGTGPGVFVRSITGLAPGTDYHVRAYATNSVGTSYGSDLPFTTDTAAEPPVAVTGSTTSVTPTAATLDGTVNPNGAATAVVFECGTDTGYGKTATADQSPVSDPGDQPVSVRVTGLIPGMYYHFRVKATNSAGTDYGEDKTFSAGEVQAMPWLMLLLGDEE